MSSNLSSELVTESVNVSPLPGHAGTGGGTESGGTPVSGGAAALGGRAAGVVSAWSGRLGPFNLGALLLAALIALGVSAVNMGIWQFSHPTFAAPEAPDAKMRLGGVAYNAFRRWDSPLTQDYPTDAEIEADMALLARHTDRLRTYSSSEMPQIPELAGKYGLRVTQGIWLDLRYDNNEREIAAGIEASRKHRNVERLMLGNETILHGMISPYEMVNLLKRVRAQVDVPVSTAEPWHVWLRYPELAENVDFITVHLLPYWEGVPHKMGVDYALMRLDELKKRFPGKHIVIGEIGWPAQGDVFDGAEASRTAQAYFIRDFLSRTPGQHWDYFLMEAIDQPWKRATEGRVGSYWGFMDADREPKYAFTGPIETDPNWQSKALAASLLALLPMIAFLAAFRHLRLPSRIFFASLIQGCASLAVWLLAIPYDYYLRPVDWIGVAVLVPTVLVMVIILLANGFEFAEMFWRGNLRRRFAAVPLPNDAPEPRVSIHLACCNEPPAMVIATLDSLAALDWRNFEVIVVDNNTKDEALWKPVQAHCALLGERFRFFHLPQWPGFKAGALNFALEQTDPTAEVVGVVDADYVVKPDWLRGLVGRFADPKVAVVQAPQAHRDYERHPFSRMMNYEFDGFFRIGMHHRNERDAIIQHGTMTLVRADALREHGRWSEWCICEDTELGLRLMRAGLRTEYVDRVMGEGLVPEGFAAFRKQRRRWAQGAMQILRAHWKQLFLGRKLTDESGRSLTLTGAQRYHFVAGWLSWFGDALHLVFAFAAMFWTIGMIWAPHLFSLPIVLFMLPVFLFFVGKALMGPLLYARNVDCSWRDVLGAALAGMGLSHGIALGVFAGLRHKRAVFEITQRKPVAAATAADATTEQAGVPVAPATTPGHRRAARPTVFSIAREESLLFAALMTCLAATAIWRPSGQPESLLWMWILGLQSVPYLAAIACAWISLRPESRSTVPVVRRQSDGARADRLPDWSGAGQPIGMPPTVSLPLRAHSLDERS